MALPVNIEDLLNKRKVEGNRIEFKKGWNPISTYHTICAFANDIDNIGGGYILIGVDEVDGIAQRPVEGVPLDKLDYIQRSFSVTTNCLNHTTLPRFSWRKLMVKTLSFCGYHLAVTVLTLSQ